MADSNLEVRLKEFFKDKDYVYFAYLFGSAARKRTGPLSDVDIAVFIDESLDKHESFRVHMDLIDGLVSLLRTDRRSSSHFKIQYNKGRHPH